MSDEVLLASGVPHGSVISPFLWNYWLGDCPTTNHKAAHLSFYADDLSLWISHVSGIKSLDILNDEIRRLVNWTKRKRFNLEPTKSHALVLHKEKRVRNNIKAYPVWLDKNNRVQINWVSDATLLGVKFWRWKDLVPIIRKALKSESYMRRKLSFYFHMKTRYMVATAPNGLILLRGLTC